MGHMTNLPNGFPYGVALRGVPILQTNPGNVYWVDSATGSNGNKGTVKAPLATVEYAVSICSANNGDIILVVPGHTETISDATTFALNVAGVAIIGLGNGNSVPTFTIGTANTATIPVSADNISIQNCRFIANFLSIAACFTLTTAKDFLLQDCLFKDTSGVLDFLNIVKSTGAANTVDGLTISRCKWASLGTTSVNSLVLSANDIDRLTITDNVVIMSTTVDQAALAVITAGVVTHLDMGRNKVFKLATNSSNGALINVGGTTSTGLVYENYAQWGTTGANTDIMFVTTVGLGGFGNYFSGAQGASGYLLPAADS